MKQTQTSCTNAFTMAEVLISLVVIGIVAILTLPTLIKKYEERATITKVKKAYTQFSEAIKLAVLEQGSYDFSTSDCGQKYYEYLSPYLNISKYCGTGKGCWPNTMIKHLHGTDWVNMDSYSCYTKAILADGTSLQVFRNGEIRVDVNGFKGPNTVGKDIFAFSLRGNNLVPAGIANEDKDEDTLHAELCNLASTASYNGYACTAWVIYYENMDYLHCNDLSWSGKHKCSN